MLWVVVFVSIALAGVAMVAGFAFWLWRKTSDLMGEASTVLGLVDRFFDLLAQIRVPEDPYGSQEPDRLRTARGGIIDKQPT